MIPRDASDLYADRDLAQFYDVPSGAQADVPAKVRADFATCEKLAQGAASILDLGCGTGVLATRIAGNASNSKHAPRIVGADPAKAMLDIAAAREDGDKVRWVEASAETLDLDERFDLIRQAGLDVESWLGAWDGAPFHAQAREIIPIGKLA